MNAHYGWESDLGTLITSDRDAVIRSLESFVKDASQSQVTAWKDSVKVLQMEGGEAVTRDALVSAYRSILEYQLPMEARRPDVILLENGSVLVLEFKGREVPTAADIDQVSAYSRDLKCYHRECADRPVHALLIPVRYKGPTNQVNGTYIVNPKDLDGLIASLGKVSTTPLTTEAFTATDAYSPLPSLVRAARELFESRTVRNVWRARASTDPAVELITRVTHEAAKTKTRRLILLTGVPGSGKTLVGLRVVHAGFLDDLSVEREKGKPTAPAVFLSGNGPLVEVLQYELKRAGGNGRTFVRGVKNYVEAYTRRPDAIPPEHFLVFDEAQRAWDADQVAEKHGAAGAKSEPEHFIEFAERIPEWCVVLGLIGSGQEIHKGEEGGIDQWRKAVENSGERNSWTIHSPPQLAELFGDTKAQARFHPELNLTCEIRYHLTPKIHDLVDGILQNQTPTGLAALTNELAANRYPIYITRSLDKAKQYVKDRYEENPDARYGLLASARDKDLPSFGIFAQYQDTKNLRIGPWFSEDETNPQSCRRLEKPITEFQAQGLELDFSIVCWGSDLIRQGGVWSDQFSRKFKKGSKVRDAFQLRVNSYRVLLTRGRDGMVVFVPSLDKLDGTYAHLKAAGLIEL
jgi:DUF2075 family protein